MRIYIKYMVGLNCKTVVQEEIARQGIQRFTVDLGVADIADELSDQTMLALKDNLFKRGFVILEDRRNILIQRIQSVIGQMIQDPDEAPDVNFSEYISGKLCYDYTYLSNVFSAAKAMSIQQYIIQHKINRVKEMLQYGGLNLTEIAHRMHYSSVAHLSTQFKKVTGQTPSVFKKLIEDNKVPIQSS